MENVMSLYDKNFKTITNEGFIRNYDIQQYN